MKGNKILNYLIILLLFGGFLIFLYFAQGKITGFAISSTVSNVVLSSTSGNNLEIDNLTVTFASAASDQSGVKNITNWFINGSSIAVLNMPFEGGSNSTYTKDYSGFLNHGEVYNGTIFNSTGGHDNFGAYTFDGVDDYIKSGMTYDFTGHSEISVEFWIKPSRNYTEEVSDAFFTHKGLGKPYKLFFEGTPDAIAWEPQNSGATKFLVKETDNTYLNANTWYHLVGVVNGSFVGLYKNGVLTANRSDFTGTLRGGTDNVIIGSKTTSNFFNGTIDEFRIYNRSLSSEQIKSLYQNRTDLIVSQETIIGNQWRVDVTPNDRTEDGATVSSNTLTIIEADTTAPTITINSPENKTYTSSAIEFNITTNENAGRAWFTIDGGTTNYTMTNNTNKNFNYTLTNVANNNYAAKFYANDSFNNINNTESVNFTVSVSLNDDGGNSGGGGGGSSSSLKKSNLSATEVSANNKISNIQNFSNDSSREQFEISLIDVSRRKGFVDAEYVIKNLANEDREVKLYFSILNSNENLNSEIEESHFIQANSEKTFGVTIPIDKNLNEEIILIVDFEKYSSFNSESAPIRSPISGLAIVNAEKNKNNFALMIILSLLSFIVVIFILYKIIKNRKNWNKKSKTPI